MAAISIEELKQKATTEVKIVGYEEGEHITLRLKRISLLGMVKSGKIPNQLLARATQLFTGVKKGDVSNALDDMDNITEMSKILDLVCEEAMVEPTFADANEYLTDDQKSEIFNWTQSGVAGLTSFRDEQRNLGLITNE